MSSAKDTELDTLITPIDDDEEIISNSDTQSIKTNEAMHEVDLSDLKEPVTNDNNDNNDTQTQLSNIESDIIMNVDDSVDPITLATQQLMTASQKGDIETISKLIDSKDSIIDVNSKLSDTVSALHWACLNNKLSTVKYLVSKGAEVDCIGGDLNSTPLHWCTRYGLVYITDYLIRHCNADYKIVDSQGFNLLHLSVHSSNIMMIIYILNFTDIDINSLDPMGRSALHWATYQSDILTVDLLLKKNAKIDIASQDGFVPLFWSIVSGNKAILTKLFESGAGNQLSWKTRDGKDAWIIANDMNCTSTLKHALTLANCDLNGVKIKRILNEKQGKLITFLTPYIILPICWSLITDGFIIFKMLLASLIFIGQLKFLINFIIPSYNNDQNRLLKSPFFAGIFSSTAFWCTLTWLSKLLSWTFIEKPFENFIFSISATLVFGFFFKAMIIDPGYVPIESNVENIKSTIVELIDLRKFDARYFCIKSFVRIPLRSKMSKIKGKLVAKFDHYCPWVYNDIGVRNHKLFFAFAISLEISIILYLNLAMEYFDELDEVEDKCFILNDELCTGYYKSPFIFNLFVWTAFQLVWLTVLLGVQLLQISKGLTTEELGHMHRHRVEIFNSAPTDEPNVLDDDDDALDDVIVSGSMSKYIPSFILNSKLFKILGFNQVLILTDDFIGNNHNKNKKINFDYGFKQNWLDFLFMKFPGDDYSFRTLFKLPLSGEANLNGDLVDYYKLYKIPQSV
ncbi:hypothetical protein CANARDRAFT_29959 [[Candida] arabinofermentans NRRL YB-2248]|uniref:Palmitoyltransferase n=1 Tax=[Candida] arabinofermentans NRRL YB-2248 TaxID=983967 RepID=A0A1E4SVK7_9ASCO|nr:hypothetical protein CANARDRAFT_29959 [[Candida] arabinofermentans NRRL YB-2248]